jgi:hypothetical protein
LLGHFQRAWRGSRQQDRSNDDLLAARQAKSKKRDEGAGQQLIVLCTFGSDIVASSEVQSALCARNQALLSPLMTNAHLSCQLELRCHSAAMSMGDRGCFCGFLRCHAESPKYARKSETLDEIKWWPQREAPVRGAS